MNSLIEIVFFKYVTADQIFTLSKIKKERTYEDFNPKRKIVKMKIKHDKAISNR